MKALIRTAVAIICVISCQVADAQISSGVEKVGSIYNNWNRISSMSIDGDKCYVTGDISGLQIIDVSNPHQAFIQGGFNEFNEYISSVCIDGDYAYAGCGRSIWVIDVSNPEALHAVGRLDTEYYILDVSASEPYLIFGYEYGIGVVDISNPQEPVLLGINWEIDYVSDVIITGDLGFVAGKNRFYTLDFSDPENPAINAFLEFPRGLYLVEKSDDLVLGGDGPYLYAIDISNPDQPEVIGTLEEFQYISGVSIDGDLAYVTDFTGSISAVNVSDPENMLMIGTSHTEHYIHRSCLIDGHVITSDDPDYDGFGGGLYIYDANDPEDVDQVWTFEREGFVSDVAVRDDFAFTACWDGGFRVIDYIDPENPVEIATFETNNRSSGITLHEDYAFVSEMAGGFRIFDISDPEFSIEEVGQLITNNLTYDLVVQSDIVFTAGYDGGVGIYDVSDFDNLHRIGRYMPGQYTIDVAIKDNIVYALTEHNGLGILDVSEPNHPRGFDRIEFQNGQGSGVTVQGNYLYLTNQQQGLIIYDISSPSQPEEVSRLDIEGETLDVDVVGDQVMLSCGTGGLKVVNISNPWHPFITGYYDTPGTACAVAGDNGIIAVADYTNLGFYDYRDAMQVVGTNQQPPVSCVLLETYPNPFNSISQIEYQLVNAGYISLGLYDLNGRMLNALEGGYREAGVHRMMLNGGSLGSGTYVVRLEVDGTAVDKPILLVK